MALTTHLQKGMYIMYNGDRYLMQLCENICTGRGGAINRTKLKNLSTGRVTTVTFRSGEKIEELDVNITDMQYLYSEEKILYFMDTNTYEQISSEEGLAKDKEEFMKEGDKYTVITHNNKIVYIKFPPQVTLSVTHAEPGVKGNTTSNATKKIVLETGLEILAPLFINEGDKVKIDPETGHYKGRVTT